MEVLIWQCAILAGLGLSALLFGKLGLQVSVAAATIWTVVMLFSGALIILQFATIAVGAFFGGAILRSPSQQLNKNTAWAVIAAGALLAAAFAFSASRQSRTEIARVPVSSHNDVVEAPLEEKRGPSEEEIRREQW